MGEGLAERRPIAPPSGVAPSEQGHPAPAAASAPMPWMPGATTTIPPLPAAAPPQPPPQQHPAPVPLPAAAPPTGPWQLESSVAGPMALAGPPASPPAPQAPAHAPQPQPAQQPANPLTAWLALPSQVRDGLIAHLASPYQPSEMRAAAQVLQAANVGALGGGVPPEVPALAEAVANLLRGAAEGVARLQGLVR